MRCVKSLRLFDVSWTRRYGMLGFLICTFTCLLCTRRCFIVKIGVLGKLWTDRIDDVVLCRFSTLFTMAL